MKLNRARALFLVGTIAAVACTVEDGDEGGDGGAGGDDSGGSAGSAGKGGSAGSATAGKGGSAGSAGSSAGESGAAGAPSTGAAGAAGDSGEGGDGGVGPAGAGGSAEGGASGAGSGGAENEGGAGPNPTCDEAAVWSVSCEGLAASACEGIETFLNDECAIAGQTLKGYVADAVRSCMIGLPEAELCDSSNTYACLQQGLLASCPDDTTNDDCETILATCEAGTVSAADCSTYLSGMLPEGRAQMVACIQSSSPLSCDLWSCAEGLDYPSEE